MTNQWQSMHRNVSIGFGDLRLIVVTPLTALYFVLSVAT